MLESKEGQQVKGSWGQEIWEIIKVLLISLVIVLPIRYFIAQPFIVRGASMEPNFEDREYLIVDEVSYYFHAPQRRESIVFRYPRDPRQFFIKRIIGLPSETVEIQKGHIKIFNPANPQGFLLEESYLDPPDRFTHPDGKFILTREEYFVMGDNRDFSSDSRIWGPLNKKFIVGRTFFRAWPVNKLGLIPNYALSY